MAIPALRSGSRRPDWLPPLPCYGSSRQRQGRLGGARWRREGHGEAILTSRSTKGGSEQGAGGWISSAIPSSKKMSG